MSTEPVTDHPGAPTLPDGLVAVVKRDCPTCTLVAPVLGELADGEAPLTVYSQDDPAFPEGVAVVDDRDLDVSWHHDIETVPTLLKVRDGAEVARVVGWSREQWVGLTGVDDLGAGLPDWRPGCGSLSVDPVIAERLAVRFSGSVLRSRRVELAALEDDIEAMFDRGWTDGLPVVPPTEARVLRMLEGTDRAPDEVVAVVPPELVECTVEKVAVNAVMAGCRPEYLPVVLACLEAACTDEFNAHGLLCTTYSAGPVVIVNGPIARAIGMNSGVNALGQGNRANSTIGRALQLVIRNVGGGRPGEIDRAAHGNPGKLSFCFAEDEDGSPWEPLSVARGIAPGDSAVTLFPGEGMRIVVDQLSRDPESLARSFAAYLRTVAHPKLALAFDAVLVVGPEHARVFADAGWSRQRLLEELHSVLQIPGAEMIRGANGIAEGLPVELEGRDIPKFRPDGILVVHAGGTAGMFSAIIGGWANGATGSTPTTHRIATSTDRTAVAVGEVAPA
ncbi:MAG: thioredoxin family protein [Actinomycetota bacterium]|nr:thioredoxin family protein [Actinomycetota bacterium]